MRTIAWFLFVSLTSGWTVAQVPAQDWPMWRGPHSSGAAAGASLPDPWPEGALKPAWTARLGDGWSSPVVAEDVVVVSDRSGDQQRLLGFDAQTGRVLWQRARPVDFDPHAVGRRHGNGPKSTPLIHAGRAYGLGIAGWLACVDLRNGELVWEIDLPAKYATRQALPDGRAFVDREDAVIVPVGQGQGAPVPLFGYTGSPVLEGERLIAPVGGAKGATLMAFDTATGRELWRSLDDHLSYSSPIVATLAGRRQVVYMTGSRVVGLDVADGRLLWSYPFQVQYDESIATPIVIGELVVITGDGHAGTALRIAPRSGRLEASLAWENDDLSSYLSSMVSDGQQIFGMNDGGEFACVDPAQGKTLWTGGHHGYYSTPVLAGARLLCLNERGSLLVLAAEPQAFRQLGKSQLADQATWTSPAVGGRWLYVRADEELRAFRFR